MQRSNSTRGSNMMYSADTMDRLKSILGKFPAMNEEDILLFGIEVLEKMYEMAEQEVERH